MSEKFDIFSKIFFRDVGNFVRYLCVLALRHQMRVSNYFVNSFYSVPVYCDSIEKVEIPVSCYGIEEVEVPVSSDGIDKVEVPVSSDGFDKV